MADQLGPVRPGLFEFLWTMAAIKLTQGDLLFSQRDRFWRELSPICRDGDQMRLRLPDGLQFVKWSDYKRAMLAAKTKPIHSPSQRATITKDGGAWMS